MRGLRQQHQFGIGWRTTDRGAGVDHAKGVANTDIRFTDLARRRRFGIGIAGAPTDGMFVGDKVDRRRVGLGPGWPHKLIVGGEEHPNRTPGANQAIIFMKQGQVLQETLGAADKGILNTRQVRGLIVKGSNTADINHFAKTRIGAAIFAPSLPPQ